MVALFLPRKVISDFHAEAGAQQIDLENDERQRQALPIPIAPVVAPPLPPEPVAPPPPAPVYSPAPVLDPDQFAASLGATAPSSTAPAPAPVGATPPSPDEFARMLGGVTSAVGGAASGLGSTVSGALGREPSTTPLSPADFAKSITPQERAAAPTGSDSLTNPVAARGIDPMAKASQFLGQAYVWGGKSPDAGFDCSGLAGYLSTGQAESTGTLYAKSGAINAGDLQAGDLVFYNMNQGDPHLQHVGTYIGDGKLVQAGGNARTVNIADINQSIGSAPEFRRVGAVNLRPEDARPAQAADITTSATQTTAGISGGGALAGTIGEAGQQILSGGAQAASWLGEQGQKALQAVLVTEGGLNKARGDNGQSAGPLQFYEGGQLANLAKQLGLSFDDAKKWVEDNPVKAIEWAIGTAQNPGYLGGAIANGIKQGLTGAALATFAQQHGQVSVSPERAGQNFDAMFGGGGALVSGAEGGSRPSSVMNAPMIPGVELNPEGPDPLAAIRADTDTRAAALKASVDQTAAQNGPPAQATSTDQTAASVPTEASQDPIQQYTSQLSDAIMGMIKHATASGGGGLTEASAPTSSDSLTNPARPAPTTTPLPPSADAAPSFQDSQTEAGYKPGGLADTLGHIKDYTAGGIAGIQTPTTGNGALDVVTAPFRAIGTASSALGTAVKGSGELMGGPSVEFPTGGPLAAVLTGGAREMTGQQQLGREFERATGVPYATFEERGAAFARDLADGRVTRADMPPDLQKLQDTWNDIAGGVGSQQSFEAYGRAPASEQGLTETYGAAVSTIASLPLSAEGAPLIAKVIAEALQPGANINNVGPVAKRLMGGREFEALAPTIEAAFAKYGVRMADEAPARMAQIEKLNDGGHNLLETVLNGIVEKVAPGVGVPNIDVRAPEWPGKLAGGVASGTSKVVDYVQSPEFAARFQDLVRSKQGGQVAIGGVEGAADTRGGMIKRGALDAPRPGDIGEPYAGTNAPGVQAQMDRASNLRDVGAGRPPGIGVADTSGYSAGAASRAVSDPAVARLAEGGADAASPPARTLFQRLQDAPLLTVDDAAYALGSKQMPQYLEGVVGFLTNQRAKITAGELTPRDVTKALLLTLSSMRSKAAAEGKVAARLKGMFTLPGGTASTIGGKSVVRPEDATAAWMLTPEGRAALDSLSSGAESPEARAALESFRKAAGFGSPMMSQAPTVSKKTGQVNPGFLANIDVFSAIPAITEQLNAAAKAGDWAAFDTAGKQLRGIGPNKIGFIKHLLGMGNGLTMDSNEINWWLTGIPDAKFMPQAMADFTDDIGRASPASGVPGYLGKQITDRFAELRQLGYGADIPEDAYNHVMHHWLWDTIKDAKTTHATMYDAMQRAQIMPTFATDIAGMTAGGIIGNESTPEDASLLERGGRIAAGAVAGGAGFHAAGGRILSGMERPGGGRSLSELLRSRQGGQVAIGGRAAGAAADQGYSAERLMRTYDEVTPARVTSIKARATANLAPRITPRGGDPAAADALIDQVWQAGTRLLEQSKVVATGLSPEATAALVRGEGFTNKLNIGGTAAETAAITRKKVGVGRVDLEQAGDFVRREAHGDNMVLGSTQAVLEDGAARDPEALNRVYAYVTAGPPLIGPTKPTIWLTWEDDTARVTTAHHHYGIGSPNADIHVKSTPPGLKEAMWNPTAVVGGTHEATDTGPLVTGWESAGHDVGGGRKIADTDLAVGPSGENDMRMATTIFAMPQDMADRIRSGELTDPEQIAGALLRESPGQQQPAARAGKQLLGLPEGPGVKAVKQAEALLKQPGNATSEELAAARQTLDAAEASRLSPEAGDATRLAGQDNGMRTESLIVDPKLEKIKAIYIAGVPKDLTDAKELANVGGKNRLQLAQELRQRILDETGRDVPILFKDVTPELNGEVLSMDKSINTVRTLAGPEGVQLAPGRGNIVSRYMGAGYKDVGQASVPFAQDMAGATAGGIIGNQTTPDDASFPERVGRTALGVVGGTTLAHVASNRFASAVERADGAAAREAPRLAGRPPRLGAVQRGEVSIGGQAPESSRFYHGGGSAFDSPDPGKFDPNGLYGPGYYLTDDPRVASSYAEGTFNRPTALRNTLVRASTRLAKEADAAEKAGDISAARKLTRQQMDYDRQIAEMDRPMQSGPNMRAVDVPKDLKLFDVSAAPEVHVLQQFRDALPEGPARDLFTKVAFYSDEATSTPLKTGDDAYKALERALNVAEDQWTGGAVGEGKLVETKARINSVLQQAGFNGIAHPGGQINAMMDDAGQPIAHNVNVIFERSLEKVRNATSGRQGGQIGVEPMLAAAGAVGGGAAGNASTPEDASPLERGARIAGGALAGGAFGGFMGAQGSKARGEVNLGVFKGKPPRVPGAPPASRTFDLQKLAAQRAELSASQPGLLNAPAKSSVLDKVIGYTAANMLSAVGTAVQNTLGGLGQTVARPVFTFAGGHPSDAARDVLVMAHTLGEAFAAYGTTLKTGQRIGRHYEAPVLSGKLGTALSASLRNLGATDEFFRVLNGAGASASEASRYLRENPTLSFDEVLSKHVNDIAEAGATGARRAVLEEGGGAMGSLGAKLSELRNEMLHSDNKGEVALGLTLQWVVPMTRVPGVILGEGIRGLPVVNELVGGSRAIGKMTSGFRSAQKGVPSVWETTKGQSLGSRLGTTLRAGDHYGAQQELGRTSVQSFANFAILSEVAQGNITGDGPTNAEEKAKLMEAVDKDGNAVWRPNSIRLPGGRWLDYSGLGSIAFSMSCIANLTETAKDYAQKPEAQRTGMPQLATELLSRQLSTVGNSWYLKTTGDIIAAVKSGQVEKLAGSVTQIGDRLVPAESLLNEIRRVADPITRDPSNPLERLQNRLPGASAGVGPLPAVPPRLTATTGRPVQDPKDILSTIFRGSPGGGRTPNPVAEEIARLNEAGKNVSAPKQDNKYAGAKQSEEQTTLLRETVGKATNLYVLTTMADPDYAKATDAQKADALNHAVSQAVQASNVDLGGKIARDPKNSAILAWSQTPHYRQIDGTPDEIARQNFQVAEAKSKLAAYRKQYGDRGDQRLRSEDAPAYKLSQRDKLDSAKLAKAKAAIDAAFGGALLSTANDAASAGLVGVGSTVLEPPD